MTLHYRLLQPSDTRMLAASPGMIETHVHRQKVTYFQGALPSLTVGQSLIVVTESFDELIGFIADNPAWAELGTRPFVFETTLHTHKAVVREKARRVVQAIDVALQGRRMRLEIIVRKMQGLPSDLDKPGKGVLRGTLDMLRKGARAVRADFLNSDHFPRPSLAEGYWRDNDPFRALRERCHFVHIVAATAIPTAVRTGPAIGTHRRRPPVIGGHRG